MAKGLSQKDSQWLCGQRVTTKLRGMRSLLQFKFKGYIDWRLPTIEEWRSVVDKKEQRPSLVEPNAFENMIVHVPYWSKTEFTLMLHKQHGKNVIKARW